MLNIHTYTHKDNQIQTPGQYEKKVKELKKIINPFQKQWRNNNNNNESKGLSAKGHIFLRKMINLLLLYPQTKV